MTVTLSKVNSFHKNDLSFLPTLVNTRTHNENSSRRAKRPTINEKTSIFELLLSLINVTGGNALSLEGETSKNKRRSNSPVTTHSKPWNPLPPQSHDNMFLLQAILLPSTDKKHEVYAL